jgi:hypothetical protein
MAKLGTSILAEKLFPDGNIVMPKPEEFVKKIANNTFTVRDALVLHLNDEGFRVGEGELKKSALAEQVREVFKKSDTTLSTMAKKVTALESILDKNYYEVTENIVDQAGVEEFNKLIGKQVGLVIQSVDRSVSKFVKSRKIKKPTARETIAGVKQTRGGKAFKQVPEPKIVWPAIMEAAQKMAVDKKYGPEVAKNFILAAILPLRNSDLGQITTNKEFSQGLETVRPYIYKTPDGGLGITLPGLTDAEKMAGRGLKGAPQIELTKFLSNMLEVDYKKAFDKDGKILKNYLFDSKKVTTANMTSAVKDYFKPLMRPYEEVLGRSVAGIADVRKIAASTIAKHPDVKSPAIASQLLGHTNERSYLEGLTKLDVKSYISDIYEEGAENKVTRALTLYESLITKTVSPETLDINQIARIANIPLNNENIAIDIIENVAEKQTTRKLSPDEIEENKILKKKRFKLQVQRLDEQTADSAIATEEKLTKAQETKQARQAGLEDAPEKKINFQSDLMQAVVDEYGLSTEEIQEIKSLPAGQQNTALDELLKNKKPITKDIKPEGQAMVAEPEIKTPFLDIEGAGDVAAIDMEKAGRVIDPLVDVITALPIGKSAKALGQVGKAIVGAGKGLGKALKPDLKDPVERFDILEPLPKEEEKETTEERTRGQVNNLFDFPLGP